MTRPRLLKLSQQKISGGRDSSRPTALTSRLRPLDHVVADCEMTAHAIAQNERKSAANIKQIVAFEEFGDRKAECISKLMRLLPGVGIVDGGQTAGSTALRGLPESNTVMQLDDADRASGYAITTLTDGGSSRITVREFTDNQPLATIPASTSTTPGILPAPPNASRRAAARSSAGLSPTASRDGSRNNSRRSG